jgi:hypothetical protein
LDYGVAWRIDIGRYPLRTANDAFRALSNRIQSFV